DEDRNEAAGSDRHWAETTNQHEPWLPQPRHAVYIGTSRAGLEPGSGPSLEQDAERRRRGAALEKQSLRDTEVDLFRSGKHEGIGVRIARPHQLGETPVENLVFGQLAPLLLSGGHCHTVRRSDPADAEGSAGPGWTRG